VQYSDDELLKLVGEERKRSIGFGEGDNGALVAAREVALAYVKGEMNDVPSLPNRSRAVDSTVADAIETVLPDVMEVFVGGEDVATFVPQGADDEDRAQEETDFVNHIIFTENEGFLTLYTAIKDALTTRTGVIHWWWEEEEKSETVQSGLDPMTAEVAQMGLPGMEMEEGEDGTFALVTSKLHGKVCIKAVPSEDFTVAPDTVSLRDATYCAMKSRERVQELISRGLDPEKCRQLKSYSYPNGTVEQDRDRAGESDQQSMDAGTGDLRMVEVRVHYIRVASEVGGKLEVWRVITDSEERELLDSEMVGQIPFAAGTPYIVPHRFYGESVADKLIEVQKIKTVLLRMLLDSGYFALNQRNAVNMNEATEFTVSDLLRNEPGVPIRTKGPNAIMPVSAGALSFDIFGAMEHVSAMAEGRSGIVRNAQGLNPDTLHDTAKGAMALIQAAQKRVRMIARVFAETLVKDLVVGIHWMLREYSSEKHAPYSAKMRNQWKSDIAPFQWPERHALTVHVGVGSAGRDHDLMIANRRLELMQLAIQMQGGLDGPIMDGKNLHEALEEWERAAGSKKAGSLWQDPKDPANAPTEPKPDPAQLQAQAEMQMAQAKLQGEMQLAQAKAEADTQLAMQKHQMDAEAAQRKAEQDHEARIAEIQATSELKRYEVEQTLQLKRETTDAELQMKRELLTAELEMKRETAYLNAEVARETGMYKVQASSGVSDVQPGGDPG
jgi:hypothetical protein